MRKISPAQAIKQYCLLFCMNGNLHFVKECNKYSNCILNKKMPALKKIKIFCGECAPNFKLQECNGWFLNTKDIKKYDKCPLWIYRFSK